MICHVGSSSSLTGAKNHDLDFGVKQFRSLAQQCTFPWLLANVLGMRNPWYAGRDADNIFQIRNTAPTSLWAMPSKRSC